MLTNSALQKMLEVPEPVQRQRREIALQVVEAALAAVDPAKAVRQVVSFDATTAQLTVAGRNYDLNAFDRIIVVGAGKAGTPMAAAIYSILGNRVTDGAINVKYGHLDAELETGPIAIQEAGHPILDEAGIAGTRQILRLLQNLTSRDLVIALFSGGGSALMELPVDGVTLADMQAVSDALLRAGATINQLNAVRKHLSQVKGGNLARLAGPATVISLIVSDVVGSPLDVIASGPTAPDSSTFAAAWQVLTDFNLTEVGPLPASVVAHLQQGLAGTIADTPKSDDKLFEKVQNVIVADNRVAAMAAAAKAQELGLQTLLLSTYVEGEAREVARVLAGLTKEILTFNQPIARPACILVGGETTVTVRGNGKGGRNQELGLAFALALVGYRDFLLVPLATDGTDGPTDAAGAIVEDSTLARATNLNLDAADFLRRNDAYNFFSQLNDLLLIGPTNTNVNDLTLLFIF